VFEATDERPHGGFSTADQEPKKRAVSKLRGELGQQYTHFVNENLFGMGDSPKSSSMVSSCFSKLKLSQSNVS
jgi:hypothetical protein